MISGGAACALQFAGHGTGWNTTPLVALIAWLISMGAWSGPKHLVEGMKAGDALRKPTAGPDAPIDPRRP